MKRLLDACEKGNLTVEEKFIVRTFEDELDLYNCGLSDLSCSLYTLESAKEDLEQLDDAPASLTAEQFMEIWNKLVMINFQNIVLPDGKTVPRWTKMTDRQIAEVVYYADTWSEVDDLVDYLDKNYLHLERDEYYGYLKDGWDDIVGEWCEKNM